MNSKRDLVAHNRFYAAFGSRQEVRIQSTSVPLDPCFISFAATCACLILTTKSGCCKDFEGSSNPRPSLWEDLPQPSSHVGTYPVSKDLHEVSVFKHQLSCQHSTWPVEFALALPPLMSPTSSCNSPLPSALNSSHLPARDICSLAWFWTPNQQGPVLV